MFPKRPFALSNRLKTTPFQKQPRRRGSSSSENWQPEIAPRRGRGPSPVRRCSSGSARASSAAPPEQSPARRDRGQRQRCVKRPASRPASENVPRLGRVGDTTCDSVNFIIKAHSDLLQGYRADTERSRDSSPAEPGLSPARGTLAIRSFESCIFSEAPALQIQILGVLLFLLYQSRETPPYCGGSLRRARASPTRVFPRHFFS